MFDIYQQPTSFPTWKSKLKALIFFNILLLFHP